MLSIIDVYNIPIDNFIKLVANVFDYEKCVLQYENLQLFLKLRLKLKKCIMH